MTQPHLMTQRYNHNNLRVTFRLIQKSVARDRPDRIKVERQIDDDQSQDNEVPGTTTVTDTNVL